MNDRTKTRIGWAVALAVAASLLVYSLGYYHAVRGGIAQFSDDIDEGIEFFLVAYEKNPDAFMVAHDLAGCYALKGDVDECFMWLERALASSYGSYAKSYARTEADFDSVRELPRFQELVFDR